MADGERVVDEVFVFARIEQGAAARIRAYAFLLPRWTSRVAAGLLTCRETGPLITGTA
ncbi:hypothetical protein ACH4S8_08670 [Streptomyces sp. NPDC021080]|uniref:hypothetical protein n=1 Tax=Streptomyces sp. NPDC021080 TaxID=3365110 RepID=UPI0037BB41C5